MSESQNKSEWKLRETAPMYIAEFVGTMMYVVTMATIKTEQSQFNKTANAGINLAPLSVGFMLVAMVYAFGHISGAHFNPAVTLSVFIRGFISLSDAILFSIVQVCGGIAGAFLSVLLTDKYPTLEPNHIGRAFLAELLYTFALCVVVINVATTDSQRGNFFYGVAIGLTVSVGATAVWNISGGVFNPAVGTALTITNVINGGSASHLWLYWLAPLTGGMLGGFSFYIINTKEATTAWAAYGGETY